MPKRTSKSFHPRYSICQRKAAKMRPSRTRHTKRESDVVIVGGGPSGLALSAVLGSAGFSVVCLERNPPRAERVARNDGRTTALSFGSVKILKKCGVWPALKKSACPILDIRIADCNSSSFLDFGHAEIGDRPFGWIIENHFFHRALLSRARALKNVRIVAPAAMEKLETDDAEARIVLTDGRIFAAPLAIAADGRDSQCRERAGIPVYGWEYDQTALVCTIAHELPHYNVAIEHFLPGGPLATLPMTRQRSSIVWTERSDAADILKKMSDEDFTAALEDKVRDWLGRVRLAGPRFAFPLSLRHAERYIGKRLVLIGDAAHGIHPIAGQGFNLGVGDIGALTEELERAASLGLDLGDALSLRRFEKRRKFADGNMVLATDTLDRLFSNSIPPIQAARRLGLGVVGQLPPLKRFFMRTAMGT